MEGSVVARELGTRPRESAVVASEIGCWDVELPPNQSRSQADALVVDPDVFAQSAKEKFSKWADVDESATKRAEEVRIGPDDVPPRISGIRGGWGTRTGCWAAHKNTCLRELHAAEERQFVRLRAAVTRMVDQHKSQANNVEIVLQLKSSPNLTGFRLFT